MTGQCTTEQCGCIGPGAIEGCDFTRERQQQEGFANAARRMSNLGAPHEARPWLAPLWLGLAQRYALQRSLAQGLDPDNPFPDGTVNRVVQGVTIHH